MKTDNVKWELELLINKKAELKKVGLDLDYNEDNRVKELRKFLDADEEIVTGPTTPPAGEILF